MTSTPPSLQGLKRCLDWAVAAAQAKRSAVDKDVDQCVALLEVNMNHELGEYPSTMRAYGEDCSPDDRHLKNDLMLHFGRSLGQSCYGFDHLCLATRFARFFSRDVLRRFLF